MKKTYSILLLAFVAIFSSCSNQPSNAVEANEAGEEATPTVTSVTYTVDPASTVLNWLGDKVSGDKHSGTISVANGSLDVEGEQITGGEFTIDMTSMTVTDGSDEESAAKLVGHLSSEDFFKADSFPTSTFAVTGFDAGTVTGNLTIMGTTKEISIPVETAVADDKMTITSKFTINRTDWGIVYGSSSFIDGLKDKAINDDIQFDLSLVANR